jgi:hypothetical protein
MPIELGRTVRIRSQRETVAAPQPNKEKMSRGTLLECHLFGQYSPKKKCREKTAEHDQHDGDDAPIDPAPRTAEPCGIGVHSFPTNPSHPGERIPSRRFPKSLFRRPNGSINALASPSTTGRNFRIRTTGYTSAPACRCPAFLVHAAARQPLPLKPS